MFCVVIHCFLIALQIYGWNFYNSKFIFNRFFIISPFALFSMLPEIINFSGCLIFLCSVAYFFKAGYMTTFKIAPVICSMMTITQQATSPESIDLQRYSGKWYVIGTIPTWFDNDWNYTTESYSIRPDGNIDVYTTYKKKGQQEQKTLRSKGFPDAGKKNVEWKVQFFWPFKADYLVEAIADDYSWVIVGHPKKKFLYIMARTNSIPNELYTSLVERCRQRGYNISDIRKPLQ
jgi:apolipoprotein D and lipocalin family protein